MQEKQSYLHFIAQIKINGNVSLRILDTSITNEVIFWNFTKKDQIHQPQTHVDACK